MNILDWINFMIIGASVIFCVINGFKKLSFRFCAFVIAMLLSKFSGYYFGNFLLSDIMQIESRFLENELTEKISSTIVSLLGTLILFLLLSILLKKIFRVVEGKMERSLYLIFVDTILGALAGILDGMTFVFVFTEIVSAAFFIISHKNNEKYHPTFENNGIIYRLSRILS